MSYDDGLLQDEVLSVAAEVGLSPREACGVVLGPTCEDPYDPWHQDWNISVPGSKPPIAPIPNPKVKDALWYIQLFFNISPPLFVTYTARISSQ